MTQVNQLLKEIEQELGQKKVSLSRQDVGTVSEIKDEVVFIEGLSSAQYGEQVVFASGLTGMVIDLTEELVGTIVFGDFEKIKEGQRVTGTGKIFSIPIGDSYLGRVVDGIGRVLDGKGAIKGKETAFIDSIAPGVVEREPVTTPLQTGIKAIDGLIPIGRGQRELIIGDRRIGKTTLAIDTILNQNKENVICIYCAIGQRRSNTAEIIALLEKSGALAYSIIVVASASDPASMQYVAPYTATTIAEYFMEKGRDVLVVYDDLTKHAWAYRQVSLVLRRPAGREAYPGDIFYLHSRLLERSAQMNEKNGGGSITALPIIETQEGDLSSYIPTNVISITDGQLVLDADLFNAGVRPALNIGASVSRVGGSAQTKAIKQVAGRLKLELAQYRELAAFAQFESDLDESTKKQIDRGARITKLMKQSKNNPYSLASQVILFWAGINGFLDKVPLDGVEKFEHDYLTYMQAKNRQLMETIEKTKILEKEIEQKLQKATLAFMQFNYSDLIEES